MTYAEKLRRDARDPIEKAIAWKKLLREYGCTQNQLAVRLKVDRSTIANAIRLLSLPKKIQAAVRAGTISHCHARAILGLSGRTAQLAAFQRAVKEKLSVHQVEAMVATGTPTLRSPKPPQITQTDWEFPSLANVEIAYIRLVLKQYGGNKPTAAAVLGISLKTLYNKINAEQILEEWRASA